MKCNFCVIITCALSFLGLISSNVVCSLKITEEKKSNLLNNESTNKFNCPGNCSDSNACANWNYLDPLSNTCCKDFKKLCDELCNYAPSNKCDSECCDLYCCGCQYTNDVGIDFVTAAKIALLFALIVTMGAVLVMIWRIFLQPRCFPQAAPRLSAQADTISLNSIQRRVMRLLERRPPQYEEQQDKPPTYDESINDSSSAPPLYSEVVGQLKPNETDFSLKEATNAEVNTSSSGSHTTMTEEDCREGHINTSYQNSEEIL